MQGVNEVLRCDENAPLEKNRRNALKLLALQMLRRSGPFPHPVVFQQPNVKRWAVHQNSVLRVRADIIGHARINM